MDGPFHFCGEFARLASINSSRKAIFPSFVTSLWPPSSALIRKKMRDRLSDYVSYQPLAMLWLITVPVQWSMPCPMYQSIEIIRYRGYGLIVAVVFAFTRPSWDHLSVLLSGKCVVCINLYTGMWVMLHRARNWCEFAFAMQIPGF